MVEINQVLEILRSDLELDAILRNGPIYGEHRSRRKVPVDQSACSARAFWDSNSASEFRWLLERKYGISSRYRDAVLIRISELRGEIDTGKTPKHL